MHIPKRYFVTSFNRDGYKVYGKKFLDSWAKNASQYILYVVLENMKVGEVFPEGLPKNIGVFYMDLDECIILDHRHQRFHGKLIENHPDKANEISNQFYMNYRFAAPKFGRKVLALTHKMLPKLGWRVWIDSDVIVEKPLNEALLDTVLPSGKDVAYLGRDNWHHSECGFVGYNLHYKTTRDFLKVFRRMYTKGTVYGMQEWHDSYVFDQVRIAMEGQVTPLQSYNIAEKCELDALDMDKPLGPQNGKLDVWSKTVLQEYMTHNKGATKYE